MGIVNPEVKATDDLTPYVGKWVTVHDKAGLADDAAGWLQAGGLSDHSDVDFHLLGWTDLDSDLRLSPRALPLAINFTDVLTVVEQVE